MTDQSHERLTGLSLTDRELFDRLGWFTRVRWVAVIVLILIALVAWHVANLRFPARTIAAVILIVCLYNSAAIMFAQACYRHSRVTRTRIILLANAQILCDLLAVIVLVHYTGGIENLFLLAAVFPLIIASELLERWNAYLAAIVAAGLVNAMAWLEYLGRIQHVAVERLATPADYQNVFHVAYICAAATLVFFIVVFFASTIAARLRARGLQLEHAHDELRKANYVNTYFMKHAADELREPLTNVYNIMTVISAVLQQNLDHQQMQMVRRTHQRLKNLIDVLDELRVYSEMRRTLTESHAAAVDLATLVDDVCNRMAAPLAEKTQTLAKHLSRANVIGDPDQLTQMVAHLLTNAVRYTPTGGQIHVGLFTSDRHAVITVADTGIGINPDDRDHVFKAFHRAPAAKRMAPAGTGLGLAIVEQVVENHAGHIDVSGQPDEGATFRVRLPLAPQPDQQRQS